MFAESQEAEHILGGNHFVLTVSLSISTLVQKWPDPIRNSQALSRNFPQPRNPLSRIESLPRILLRVFLSNAQCTPKIKAQFNLFHLGCQFHESALGRRFGR